MDTEQKYVSEIKLQVAHLIARLPNIPPERIVEYSIPLSEWILRNDQKLPKGIDSKE